MKFTKYDAIAPDYHFAQINRGSFKRFNAFVEARFLKLVNSVEEIVKKRDSKEPLKLLDVGCGDGVALYLISQSLGSKVELYGIEPVEKALHVARARVLNATLIVGDASNLPYEDDYFDIVITSDVIEHVDHPLIMLEEIRRVLRPDGHAIIGTPIRRTKNPIDPQHVAEFFVEDFQEMVSQYFREVQMHESHNLAATLLFNAPTKSFLNWRYGINLISLLGFNPFLKERSNKTQMFSYMYAVCRK